MCGWMEREIEIERDIGMKEWQMDRQWKDIFI